MEYVLKSILCLLLLLLFHRLVLQQEALHKFNRFFLLAAVVGSFLIPFVSIEVDQATDISRIPLAGYSESIPSVEPFQEVFEIPVLEAENYDAAEVQIPWQKILWSVYLLGVLVFLIRFLRNLRIIYHQIQGNLKVIYRQETLVLIPELVSPFSFLNYIFYTKDTFETEGIPEAVFLHEQCHVREKHTWDVLFIEALLVVFWFHPGLYLARQAIRLNHEFIADQQVIQRFSVKDYQLLLLSILSGQPGIPLGSSLNFPLTKKRFAMMNKTTSKVKKMAVLFLSLSLILFSGFLFSTKVVADKVEKSSIKPELKKVVTYSTSSQNLATYLALYGKYQTQINENRLFSSFTQEEITRLEGDFRLLDLSFAKLSLEERRQVKRPSFPFAKLTQDGKVIYKKLEDLTEEERKNMAC